MNALAQIKASMGSDYDALPLLDVEYNHPDVQRMVLELVQTEMASFAPPKDHYLGSLPYPKLRFSSAPAFAAEYERIRAAGGANSSSSGSNSIEKQVDMTRYSVPAPAAGTAEAEDVQAWTSSVLNARAQLEHQRNRLVNLELASEHGETVWQQHVASVEASATRVTLLADGAEREKNAINSQRLSAQRACAPALAKIAGKRNEALSRVLALQTVVGGLEKRQRTGVKE